MKELEQKIYGNGSITLSRTLTKGITPMNELVLSRLRTERDYAVENSYITEDGFFIVNESELSYHTGLSEDAVCAAVANLKRRNLIQGKVYENHYFICINDSEIIGTVEELETNDKYYYGTWEEDLKRVQEEILKLDIVKKENNNDTQTDTNNNDSKPKMPQAYKFLKENKGIEFTKTQLLHIFTSQFGFTREPLRKNFQEVLLTILEIAKSEGYGINYYNNKYRHGTYVSLVDNEFEISHAGCQGSMSISVQYPM